MKRLVTFIKPSFQESSMAELVIAASAIADVLLRVYEKRGELTESLRRVLDKIKDEKEQEQIKEIIDRELPEDIASRVKRDTDLIKESYSGLEGFEDIISLVLEIKQLPEVPYEEIWKKFERIFTRLLYKLGIPRIELEKVPIDVPDWLDLEFYLDLGGYCAYYYDELRCPIHVRDNFLYIDLEDIPGDYTEHVHGLTLKIIKEIVTITTSELKKAYKVIKKQRESEREEIKKMAEVIQLLSKVVSGEE